MTFAAAGFAAPGSGVGPANGTAAAVSGGGHAGSVAPAAHVSSVSIGVNHAASTSAGRSFLSTNSGTSGVRPTFGSKAGTISRSPGFTTSQGAMVRALPTVPTVHNAWSDPVGTRVAGRSGPSAQVNGARTGQILYPGAYGYANANRPANGHFGHGHAGYDGGRGHHHYYYNSFPYAIYYPYLYGGYGYGGIGYDGAVGDYAGLTAANNVADLGAPDFSTTANSYYGNVAPTQNTPGADQSTAAPPQALPDAPAVGPQSPSTAAKSPGTAQQGPDSLVEAVQDELGKRGYFAGKPDAIYGDATKEAIRRFQTDQGLPATGRINEATLHALHLD